MESILLAAGLLMLAGCFGPVVCAQQQNKSAMNASELASQNMSRVAAPAAELRAVLTKDAGLLVDLKRWVAQDATDHGQILNDADLSDDAILGRLETDLPFRSVATMLVRRYGYLLPKFDPDSDLGKQRELLNQERAKWLAQDQEQQLTQARERSEGNRQNEGLCGPDLEVDCDARPARSQSNGGPEQERRLVAPQSPQEERNPSNLPGTGGNSQRREQLLQSEEEETDVPAIRAGDASYDAASSLNVTNLTSPESRTQPMPGFGTIEQSVSVSGGGNRNPLNAIGSYGVGNTTEFSPNFDGTVAFGNKSGPAGPSAATSPVQPVDRKYSPVPSYQPPDMIRKLSPYSDIPSFYDMYVQAVTRPGDPTRFGSQLFENGSRDSQMVPMDLPAGPDYVVGPGDGLSVDLWGGVSQRLFRTVDREGRISLPEVGPVLVSGKSLADVQQNLQQVLRTQFRDISADVSLSRLRSIRVYEVGDVAKPGAYDISSLSTPLNALFAAGGPTPRGSLRILNHYRGNQLLQVVDVYDLLLHGVKTNLQRLENGDTVQVPPIGPQVTVEGMVRRPAVYELKNEKTLASVLELAGGLLPAATLRHVEVQRLVAHEKQTMLSLDIAESTDSAEVTKRLDGFEIRDGDRIRIYPIAPYNQDTIYLEGHVIRPGRYSYRADMRVSDVISSYKDLLPEPATRYAEIIRLNAPDFHPTVESFDLAGALENPAQSPLLHPLDTIRIFSRFDFENPPTVSVLGDVRAPGTYQTSGQIRLADAVHLAGGLAPDAQTRDAQVFRSLPDGRIKILSASLGQALEGDPLANVILQSRDRLLIHASPDAVQPAAVSVLGEVAKPGRYPLGQAMRVADLIRVGGGLKPSADSQTADLTKYQYSDKSKLTGEHEVVALAAALAGDTNSNATLHNGDVLTIRQLPGWNDLGASISLKGEVKHPGTYGIRPGERLSSILERAGGFEPQAYPYGAILQRALVREMELRSQNEIILRVKGAQSSLELLPDADPKQKEAKLQAIQQWQSTLDQLSSNPPPGRVTIRISSEINRWKNTPADVEVRAGDVLVIPKRPSYVMVTGQVFDPTAVSYRPGKSAKWYLDQSGGPTQLANKSAIFVIRADGSVLGARRSLLTGESMGASLQPGDTVVVPEKALGGTGLQWQTVMLIAQTSSAIASTVIIALHY